MATDTLEYRSALASPDAAPSSAAGRVLFSERPVDCVRIAAYSGAPDIAPDIARVAGIEQPCVPGRLAQSGPVIMMQIARDTWQLATALNSGERLVLALKAGLGDVAAVTPFLCGGVIAIGLSGRHAHIVLEKGIGIDFSPEAFGVGRVAATGLHGVAATVAKPAADCFEIYVARSFAASIQDWLTDAAWEFNVDLPPDSR